jgi:hypothetical protein
MALGDHLAIAGILLAFLGIGITVLWPSKRWVGWTCIFAAVLVGAIWIVLSLKHRTIENETVETQKSSKKSSPSLQWASPAPIQQGEALSAKQLNVIASVDGREMDGNFVYNPTFGATLPVGTNTLSVTFFPRDRTRYSEVTRTVALAVRPTSRQAPPSVSTSKVPFHGNLEQRTIDLAKDILENVIQKQDWEESNYHPTDRADMSAWRVSCSKEAAWRFRMQYEAKVQGITDEYWLILHTKDDRLNEIMKSCAEGERTARLSNREPRGISYFELREVPQRLLGLARTVKSYR